MLDNKKIRIMTNLAIYEQREGKEDIELSKYYKTDYIRYNILKSIINITIGYFIILCMIGMYKIEYLIEEVTKLDYKELGISILAIYILLLIIYGIGSTITYSLKFDMSRKRLHQYYRGIKLLRNYYKEEAKDGRRDRLK